MPLKECLSIGLAFISLIASICGSCLQSPYDAPLLASQNKEAGQLSPPLLTNINLGVENPNLLHFNVSWFNLDKNGYGSSARMIVKGDFVKEASQDAESTGREGRKLNYLLRVP